MDVVVTKQNITENKLEGSKKKNAM